MLGVSLREVMFSLIASIFAVVMGDWRIQLSYLTQQLISLGIDHWISLAFSPEHLGLLELRIPTSRQTYKVRNFILATTGIDRVS